MPSACSSITELQDQPYKALVLSFKQKGARSTTGSRVVLLTMAKIKAQMKMIGRAKSRYELM